MSFVDSLISGGLAGTCVDLVFFPIDTLKTRLQAKDGFFANGGWKGVYSGVGSTIWASAPGAAVFFIFYEYFKTHFKGQRWSDPATHMASACLGEIAACTIRVPSEVIKQRVQTGQHSRSFLALQAILSNSSGEGVVQGLYRGYGTTLMREIPFTAIQFPLYERLKTLSGANDKPYRSTLCGSIAGAFSAAVTTPLDVIKTRIMLQRHNPNSPGRRNLAIIREITSEGIGAFFKGVVPRTLWISAGGAVFLGVYEIAKSTVSHAKAENLLL